MSSLFAHIALKALREKSGFDQLDNRQRILLICTSLILLIFFVYQLMISPYFDSRSRLLHSVQQRQEDLQEIKKLRQEYLLVKKEEGGIRDRLAKRSNDFALFSFLDQQAEQAKVKEKIKYMKPSIAEGEGPLRESLVEMKLQETTLEGLVAFLKLIESAENVVSLRRISIQESAKEQGDIDVIMQITTFVEESGP
ncbi:MAG: type II secretion system protein GspM [Desulfoprunum sp.]|nr:type II secretion system protein GspM [Desulfoprunum sp.]